MKDIKFKVYTFSTLRPSGEVTSTQTWPNGQFVSRRQPAIHTPLFPVPVPLPPLNFGLKKFII